MPAATGGERFPSPSPVPGRRIPTNVPLALSHSPPGRPVPPWRPFTQARCVRGACGNRGKGRVGHRTANRQNLPRLWPFSYLGRAACRLTQLAEAEDKTRHLRSPGPPVRPAAMLVCPFGRPAPTGGPTRRRTHGGQGRFVPPATTRRTRPAGWRRVPRTPPAGDAPGRAGTLPGRAPASAGRGETQQYTDMECLP